MDNAAAVAEPVSTEAPPAAAAPASGTTAAPAKATESTEGSAAAKGLPTRREVRAGLADLAQKAAAKVAEGTKPAEVAAETQPAAGTSTETGKPDAAAQPAAEGDVAKPGVSPASTEGEAAPVAEAPKGIRVPVDPTHPVRGGMGQDSIGVLTEADERAVRALLNGSHTRKKEVEAAENRARDLEVQIAQRDARDAAQDKLLKDPRYPKAVERYNELKDQYGQEEADIYWRGFMTQVGDLEKIELDTRTAAIDAKRVEEAGRTWLNEAWESANLLPVHVRELPGFRGWFDKATAAFNDELGRGHFPDITPGDTAAMHAEFKRFFATRLGREKSVTDAFSAIQSQDQKTKDAAAAQVAARKAEDDRIAADAVKKHMETLAAKRGAVPPHPLGNLTRASTDRTPAESSTTGQEVPAAKSAMQARRDGRAAVREIATRHMPS